MRLLRSPIIPLVLLAVAAGILVFRFLHRVLPHTPSIPDLGVTSPLNQPGGSPAPAEAYEIYSALYDQAPAGEPLAFAGYSSTDIPQLDGSCLKPSTNQEHEMADAFVAANRQSHRFDQNFTISGGYQLLSAAQVNQALACLDVHDITDPRCQPWHQLRHVRFLGAPGLDSTHAHALVSIIRKCGHYCGSGGIFTVEKIAGTWRRADPTPFTENCSWMFQR